MAISIVSGNLNSCDGYFEGDPSLWGFSLSYNAFQLSTGPSVSVSRSSQFAKDSIFSAKVIIATQSSQNPLRLIPSQYLAVNAKKYIAKVWVYVPSSNLPAAGSSILRLNVNPTPVNGSTPIYSAIAYVGKTVTEATNTWVELELQIQWGSNATNFPEIWVTLENPSSSLNLTGQVFIDNFRIYEYEDVADPCNLAINIAGTVVTNETSTGANNGSITVATTGATSTYLPLEYSKNGGTTWQSSNVFSGLPPGIYPIVVRETGRIGCNASQSFSVNAFTASTFSFITAKTDESISGAADGSVTITVTGTTGPYTYSKNGGASYQGGNVFNGLAPGTYVIVVKDAGGVTKTAKVTIAAGAVQFEKIWHSRNSITVQKTASVGWGALANYKLYNDVRVDDGTGVFASQLIIALAPLSDGKVTFQVKEAFRDVLTCGVNLLTEFVKLTDRLKVFKHYTGEISGTSETPSSLTASLPSLVVYGGISKERLPDIDFFGTLPTTKQFLTWAPNTKNVDASQLDYLTYFIFGQSVTSLKLQVKAYFDDGTNQTSVTKTQGGVSYGQLYQLPAGAMGSGAALINAAKNLSSYEITLLDQSNNVISETRTYVVDVISHPRKRFIMFLNSLGGFEVIRLTGITSHETDIARDESVKYLPLDYNAIDGQILSNKATFRDSYSFATAPDLSKEWQNYLKDLVISPQVYVLANNKATPIVVQAATYSLDEDQNYERYIRFTAKSAFEEEVYTP